MERNKKFFVVACFFLLVGIFLYLNYAKSASKKFQIVFMNVGQGDSTLIKFENGEKMLVDCGADRNILSALGRNISFFDRKIDYLLISHPDLDHYGGCVDVLRSYEVKNIITNGREKNDPFFYEFKKSMASENSRQKIINGHEVMNIASSSLEFFSPDTSISLEKISDNDRSIVFKLVYKDFSVLFTGDMEETLEKELLKKYCQKEDCLLQSDILKVAHHGSDSSSSELFLSSVHPKKAVISVGQNSFGHPSRRVLRHLERSGAEVLRTDMLGDISEEVVN